MKEKDNQIKIKLNTAVILILLLIIIIVGTSLVIINKKDEISKDKKDTKNITKSEQTQNYTKIDWATKYSNIDFYFKFLKMENKKENIAYSPLSVKYALQMLNEGANGNTKNQIEKVIGNIGLEKYDNINNILSLENALYIRNTYSKHVKDEYKKKLLNGYNAEIKYDSFKSAANINKWIENKTFGQIKNMLRDDIVTNPDNNVILINALAIDMEWKENFDSKDSYEGKFYLENGSEMTTTMMKKEKNKSDSIAYYKDNEITAISMDLKEYENQQMEFIAIMPNNNKLGDYIENFNATTFENVINNMTVASKTEGGLDIFIPKFSFDYELPLKNDLENLGIIDAFSPELANFSNMSNISPFWVAQVLHKSNIDFTEKGVKAAEVTVISAENGMKLADEEENIEIKIDKPFMYVILDKKNGEIWFVGTVYEPNS